jgi:uncharacterized protein YndB with AHSA1/START domain
MDSYPHHLERTVVIQSDREAVFRYFTDSERWAAWWGKGSSIDPRPGGRVFIRQIEGTEVTGEVVEITPPERLVFTYGFASGQPILPGGSVVTIRLEPGDGVTTLHLRHDFTEAAPRDAHEQGWRYQLAVFGNVVANEVHAGASGAVDAWFETWSEPDAARREALVARVATPSVSFRDRFSLTSGTVDLLAHLAGVHRFMPGMRIARKGAIRHCQGMVLADWIATDAEGQPRGAGTNAFLFRGNGRIESVTGFWNG